MGRIWLLRCGNVIVEWISWPSGREIGMSIKLLEFLFVSMGWWGMGLVALGCSARWAWFRIARPSVAKATAQCLRGTDAEIRQRNRSTRWAKTVGTAVGEESVFRLVPGWVVMQSEMLHHVRLDGFGVGLVLAALPIWVLAHILNWAPPPQKRQNVIARWYVRTFRLKHQCRKRRYRYPTGPTILIMVYRLIGHGAVYTLIWWGQ